MSFFNDYVLALYCGTGYAPLYEVALDRNAMCLQIGYKIWVKETPRSTQIEASMLFNSTLPFLGAGRDKDHIFYRHTRINSEISIQKISILV